MKFKIVTIAVLLGITSMAGISRVANAVSLNPDGHGQVLLYPYYTVREGNDTFISVTNTTDQAKSVKVRFLEGVNSREVFSFNLYLSPFDVWVAALAQTGNLNDFTGNPENVTLLIPDSSCTTPYFFGDATLGEGQTERDRLGIVEFSDEFFTGEFDDPGPNELERLQSGYIEIIEMGVLVDDNQDSATAASHVLTSFDGIQGQLPRPVNCDQLVEAWDESDNGYWLGDASIDHAPPSGGLRGTGTIINVSDGTMFTYTADAIDGFSTEIIHFEPSDIQPNLNSGDVTTSNVLIDGVMDTQIWPTGVEAVSATILHDSIMNEFIIDTGINGLSEWVVTFPTKRFYTDSLAPIDTVPVAPFATAFSGNTDEDPLSTQFSDRESGPVLIGIPITIPPPPPPPELFSLSYASNVVRFSVDDPRNPVDDPTQILGETRFEQFDLLGVNLPPDEAFSSRPDAGWARIDFSKVNDADRVTRSTVNASGEDTGVGYIGLPVIGFWVNTYTNGTLQFEFGERVIANYGGSYRHDGNRSIGTVPEQMP